MNKLITFFSIVSLFLLIGCNPSMPSKQTSGAAIGGIAGGIAGSQIGKGKGRDVAMIAGALLGAALGGAVGNSMDQTDVIKTQQALETAPDSSSVNWNNPNANSYQVTPTSTFQNAQGQNCRDYTTVAIIEGKREEMQGTACRQADGSWKASN